MIRFGYFPSNAELGIINEYRGFDFNRQLKYLVKDGVFATPLNTPSDYLQVIADVGMQVKVMPGAGNFFNTYFESDAEEVLTLDASDTSDRIDLIVVEVNKTPTVLKSSLKVIKGTPGAAPVAQPIVRTTYIEQYTLAQIYVRANTTAIYQTNITDKRGSADCPWVTSLIQQVDTSTLFLQFESSFWEWFNNVKETLSTTTLMRKYTGAINTTIENQQEIEIPINVYNSVLDILQVHIEGRILREGIDYVKNGFTSITLTYPLPVKDTQVYIEVFKSVDGSEAESIADLLYNLQNAFNKTKITKDDGTDKLTIVSNLATEVLNAGVGFHTLSIPSTLANMPVADKRWRGFASFTSTVNGYILIVSEDSDVYIINYKDGAWHPWRCLYQHNVKMLYSHVSGSWMNAATTIPLSKNISNCANGIVLHFAKYGSVDDMIFHYHLPKVRHTGDTWSGQNICIEMPYEFSADGATRNTCMKKLNISDNQITGFAGNAIGVNSNMVLVGISEY